VSLICVLIYPAPAGKFKIRTIENDKGFLGSKFIIAEFSDGVLLCIALGTFVLFRSDSFRQLTLGLYLVSLGINYVPMLIYAVVIKLRHSHGASRVALPRYRDRGSRRPSSV
jgi:hypothetical protein